MATEKKDWDKKRGEYEEGLKKTLTPSLFGVLAGVLCFLIFVSTPYVVVMNGEVKEELDKGIIPDNVRAMFESKGTPLGENFTVTRESNDKWRINEEKYLFSMDIQLEDDLNNYSVSETLKRVFKTNDVSLSEDVTIAKENEAHWEITDEKAGHTYQIRKNGDKLNVNEEIVTYFIRKEAEELHFYQMPDSSDWLLPAILLVLVQKFVYPFMHTSIKGAKDWIYIAFLTGFCWFIAFSLLLNIL